MADSDRGSVTRMLDLARQGNVDAKVQLWERYLRLLYAMAYDVMDDEHRSGAQGTSDVVAEAGVRFFTSSLLENVRDREHLQEPAAATHSRQSDRLSSSGSGATQCAASRRFRTRSNRPGRSEP
jgi:hypothetical protein